MITPTQLMHILWPAVIPAANSNSSGGVGSQAASRQVSRPPTPDTHRFFANAQKVFKVSPNDVAQPGTLFGPTAYIEARQHAINAPVSIYTQPAYAPPNAPAGIYTQPAFASPSAPTGIYTQPPAAPPISVASRQAALGGYFQPAPPISSAFGRHFQPGMPMSSIRGEHFQPNPPRTTTMGGHFQPNPPSMAAHGGHFQPEQPKAPIFGGQMPAPPRPTFMKPVRLEPPKFSGKSREWATFWTAFELAVDSQQLQPFEKHLLLLQYLEKDSEAHRAIAGYPPTDANYPIVKHILYNRYGNQDALEDELFAELFHLKPVTKNVWRELRALHSDIERSCLQIEQQSRGASNDKIVCHLIKSKLPKEVLAKLLEMEDKSGGTWTAAGLRYGIDKIITDQERIDKYVSTFHPAEPRTTQDKSDKSKQDRQANEYDQQHAPTYRRPYNIEDTRSYLTQSESPSEQNSPKIPPRTYNQWPPCSLCGNDGHRPSNCRQYPTPQNRRQRLIEQKRCFSCLRQDHTARDCSSNQKCTNCQLQGHHRLICYSLGGNRRESYTPNQTIQPKLTGGNAQQQGEPQVIPTHANLTITEERPSLETTTPYRQEPPREREQKQKALLMTQTILASTRHNSTEPVQCVVFFDPGSETSYIARKLVDQLQPPQVGTDHLRIHTFANKMPKEVLSPIHAIHLQQQNGNWKEIKLNLIDKISTPMTAQHWFAKLRQGCEPFYPPNYVNTAPDILIGIRQFWKFIVKSAPISNEPNLYIIDTVFGPVLGGELDTSHSCPLEATPILPIDQERREECPLIQTTPVPPIEIIPEPPIQLTLAESGETTRESNRETAPNRKPASRHLMATRLKGRQSIISMLTSLAIIISTIHTACGWVLWPFTCWPSECPPPWNGTFGSTNAPSCSLCNLSCTNRGVAVSGPPDVQKIEVCCLQSCLTRPTSKSNYFNFDLAFDAIIIDYECDANFWTDASHIANTKIHCPAIDSCELFDCWFCIDHLQNPTCNKQWAAVLYSGIFGAVFFILGCALSCYRSVQSGLRVICHLFAFLLSTPLRFCFWLTGRKWTEDDEEKVAKGLQRGANSATRQVRRSARLAQLRANRLFRFVTIVMIIAMANTSSETISFVSHLESCRQGDKSVRRQLAHQQRTAEIHTPESSNLFGFDLQTLLFLLAYWPWIVAGVVIGLAALFLFIQFSPHFMAYRKAARLITILAIANRCGANQALTPTDIPPIADPPNEYHWVFLLASLLFVAILWRQVRLGRHQEVGLPFLAIFLSDPTGTAPISPNQPTNECNVCQLDAIAGAAGPGGALSQMLQKGRM